MPWGYTPSWLDSRRRRGGEGQMGLDLRWLVEEPKARDFYRTNVEPFAPVGNYQNWVSGFVGGKDWEQAQRGAWEQRFSNFMGSLTPEQRQRWAMASSLWRSGGDALGALGDDPVLLQAWRTMGPASTNPFMRQAGFGAERSSTVPRAGDTSWLTTDPEARRKIASGEMSADEFAALVAGAGVRNPEDVYIRGAKIGPTNEQIARLQALADYDRIRSQTLADQHYQDVRREAERVRGGVREGVERARGDFERDSQEARAYSLSAVQNARESLRFVESSLPAQVQGAVSGFWRQAQEALSSLDREGQRMDPQTRMAMISGISYQANELASQVRNTSIERIMMARKEYGDSLKTHSEFAAGIMAARSSMNLNLLQIALQGDQFAASLLAANEPTHISALAPALSILGVALGGSSSPPKPPSPLVQFGGAVAGSIVGGLLGRLGA